MSGEGKEKKIQGEMRIILYTDGTVEVKDAPDQAILAYGLLDVAREIIHESRRRGQDMPRVEVPRVRFPDN